MTRSPVAVPAADADDNRLLPDLPPRLFSEEPRRTWYHIHSGKKEASMATLVLVHGGWHGGWCWQKVMPFLEAAGHAVYAPTLTGLAERASELSPAVGLDTHIQYVVGLLQAKGLQGVSLVGHSYGGMVITGVVDAVPERIAHLVYLDTFVPRDGESMVDVSPLVNYLVRTHVQADGWSVAPPTAR